MRKPDETTTIEHKGMTVEVRTCTDATDLEWDGDEPLDPGSEGYDVLVEVRATLGEHTFTAFDSLGSIWISPDREGYAYLDEEKENVVDMALSSLEAEIQSVATGRDVVQAQARQAVAAAHVAGLAKVA